MVIGRLIRAHKQRPNVLKRIRRRLIAFIMVLVGVVMLGMMAISSANAQASFSALVDRSLDRVLLDNPGIAEHSEHDATLGMQHLPVLWIDYSSQGLEQLGTNQSQLTIDSTTLTEAVTEALSSDQTQGRIEQSHLTWRTATYGHVIRIAVADTSSIDSASTLQLINDIKLAIIGMVLLFIIAYILSGRVLAPMERAWQQQRQFVADASHELKTPLSVILANTQILEKGLDHFSEKDRQWIESSAEEAEHMKGLVEDLLELARTEEGTRGSQYDEKIDFSALVEGETLQFDAVAYERECSIKTDIFEGLQITGNKEQLNRLVKILLDNACKYAEPQTSIHVELTAQGSNAELCITNLGTPIDPKDLLHLFDRFYRSDKARSRESGGYGLGLAIAKGIVEGHGGKISVRSEAVSGTSFHVRLPRATR